jgi:HK97 family phage portal protein
MGIKNFFRKIFTSGSPTAWVNLTPNFQSQTRESAFLYACLYAITNAAINGKVGLYNAEDDSLIPYESKGKNKLYDLLYKPNEYMSHDLLIKIIISQLLFNGNSYILKAGQDAKELPTMLVPLPPMGCRLLTDPNGWPCGYEFNFNGQKKQHTTKDIIHLRDLNFNFNDLFSGGGRVNYTQLDREIIESAKNSNLSYFKNSTDVGGLITYPQGSRFNADDTAKILKGFNDLFAGERKAHRTAILTEGASYTSLKASNKDMDFIAGITQSEETILSVLGVPPAMVGRFKYAPQYNTKEQQRIFYETTTMPLMAIVDDALNEKLLPDFDPQSLTYIKHDFSKVKALEEDYLSKAQAAQILAQTWPANEVRTALGLPFKDLPQGDAPPSPVMTAFGSYAAPKADSKAVKIDFKAAKYKRPTKAQLKIKRLQRDAIFADKTPIFETAQKNYFNFQKEVLAKKISENKDDIIIDYTAAFGTPSKQADVAMAYKVGAYSDIFETAIKAEQEFLNRIAGGKDLKFYDKKTMTDRVAEWLNMNAFQWLKGAEETTLKDMNLIIESGVANGWSNAKINKRLMEYFAADGQDIPSIINRVSTMVNTEVLATMSEGSLEGMRSTPYVNGKGWITTLIGVSDHHAGHEQMDGQEVGINEYFKNPITGNITQAPGRFGSASEDINCLCDFYPIVNLENY